MKKLLGILVLGLFLITPSQADDIRDFQIEGISVGDSALDYFSEDEIKNAYTNYYPKSRKFYQISFTVLESEIYKVVNINLKKNDDKYIIYAIKGLKNYDNRHKKCLEKNQDLVNAILSIVKNTKEESYKSNFANNFGESFATGSVFNMHNGTFTAFCSKWDKKNKKVKSARWWDSLNASIAFSEWTDWIDTEAYN